MGKYRVAGLAFAVLVAGVGLYYLYVAMQEVESPPSLPVASATAYVVAGRSVQGREIRAYSYGNGAKHVLFVGGVHGGYEWNSVALAYMFMDHLQTNPGLIPSGLTIDVIPNASPDAVYAAVGKNGRFEISDVSRSQEVLENARFNANAVDLNRNFDCKWQPDGTWRQRKVSAGSEAFSEPESRALRDFVSAHRPVAAVFWHSQANAVYASECEDGILPETLAIMNVYAEAAKYPAVESFSAYEVIGDAEGWLASIGIPAITIELSTHEDVEWGRNLDGITALLQHYSGNN